MSLLDDVRRATRTVSNEMDEELKDLIAAALSDMRRTGVRESLLDPSSLDPLPKMAVILYAKANYGYDNAEAERFMASYRQTVADLLNGDENECADEDRTSSYSSTVRDLL